MSFSWYNRPYHVYIQNSGFSSFWEILEKKNFTNKHPNAKDKNYIPTEILEYKVISCIKFER